MPEPEWISQIDPLTRNIEAIRVDLAEINSLVVDIMHRLQDLETNGDKR